MENPFWLTLSFAVFEPPMALSNWQGSHGLWAEPLPDRDSSPMSTLLSQEASFLDSSFGPGGENARGCRQSGHSVLTSVSRK